MKKYSKDRLKLKRILKYFIAIFIIIAIICIIILFISLYSKNIIVEKIDSSSSDVSSDVAKNSTPIIINNVIVGGIYDKKWVACEKYYLNSKNGENTEVDAYSKANKMGRYNVGKIIRDGKTTSAYTTISKSNLLDEYFAVGASDINIMPSPASRVTNIDEGYIKDVKRALGVYRLFNTSVKITEVYDINISENEKGYIIFATNEANKEKGVYSTVIYVSSTGKKKIIKYNYANDKKNTENWPIYSFNFIADLNNDGINEILIQETREFEVKYDIIEYKNGKFFEVLSTSLKQ